MQIIKYPSRETWDVILARPVFDNTSLFETVQNVIDEVRKNGDKAIKSFTKKFDQVEIDALEVTKEEIIDAEWPGAIYGSFIWNNNRI